MSSVKPQFSGFPHETNMREFRNVLIELKKTLFSSKDVTELNLKMERFINANRKVVWPHKTSEVFHKDEAEKAVAKVTSEFQRYLKDLEQQQPKKSFQDLMDALLIVESMIDQIK